MNCVHVAQYLCRTLFFIKNHIRTFKTIIYWMFATSCSACCLWNICVYLILSWCPKTWLWRLCPLHLLFHEHLRFRCCVYNRYNTLDLQQGKYKRTTWLIFPTTSMEHNLSTDQHWLTLDWQDLAWPRK